jgi:hypothetical protein
MRDDVRANHAGLTGELRITTTPEYGSQIVIPCWPGSASYTRACAYVMSRRLCMPTLSQNALMSPSDWEPSQIHVITPH